MRTKTKSGSGKGMTESQKIPRREVSFIRLQDRKEREAEILDNLHTIVMDLVGLEKGRAITNKQKMELIKGLEGFWKRYEEFKEVSE